MYDILQCNCESIMSLGRVQNRHEAPASLGVKYKPLNMSSKSKIQKPQ